MDHPAQRIVGTIGTIIAAATVIDFDKYSLWLNIFFIFSVGYGAIFFALDTLRVFKGRPRSFDRSTESGKQGISEHLIRQLSSSGRVAIFSRDLTWVTRGSSAETMLLKKAQANELTLFVKTETKVTLFLKAQGADVRLYSGKSFNPKSRFTILNYQNSGARVMIGAPCEDSHIIKHYGSDDFEVVDLAMDFVSLLELKARRA